MENSSKFWIFFNFYWDKARYCKRESNCFVYVPFWCSAPLGLSRQQQERAPPLQFAVPTRKKTSSDRYSKILCGNPWKIRQSFDELVKINFDGKEEDEKLTRRNCGSLTLVVLCQNSSKFKVERAQDVFGIVLQKVVKHFDTFRILTPAPRNYNLTIFQILKKCDALLRYIETVLENMKKRKPVKHSLRSEFWRWHSATTIWRFFKTWSVTHFHIGIETVLENMKKSWNHRCIQNINTVHQHFDDFSLLVENWIIVVG